jgi:hypothetical protein
MPGINSRSERGSVQLVDPSLLLAAVRGPPNPSINTLRGQSLVRRRERKMQRFKSSRSAQRFGRAKCATPGALPGKKERASSANNEAPLSSGPPRLGDRVGGPCSYRADVESEAVNETSMPRR